MPDEDTDKSEKLLQCRDKQEDVQHRHHRSYCVEHERTPTTVGILSHDAPWRGETHLQEDGERQLDAEHHLGNQQATERVADENNQQQSDTQREYDAYDGMTVFDVVRLSEDARKDGTCRHAAGESRRDARQKQC